jgi:hypothetical protein
MDEHQVVYANPTQYAPSTGDILTVSDPPIMIKLKSGQAEYSFYVIRDEILIIFEQTSLTFTYDLEDVPDWSDAIVTRSIAYKFYRKGDDRLVYETDYTELPKEGDHLSNNDKFPLDLTFDSGLKSSIVHSIDLELTPEQLTVNTTCPTAEFKTYFHPYIHGYSFTQKRFKGSSRLGLSWDGVANMITSRFREQGIGLTAELAATKTFRFKHVNEPFVVSGMSYNFEVLLGFFGLQSYPITSHKKTFIDHYANLAADPVTEFEIDIEETKATGDTTFKKHIYLPLLTKDTKDTHNILGVIPIIIKTIKPPLYKLKYSLEWGTDAKMWCSIHSTTGTLQVVYHKDVTAAAQVVAKVSLFQGDGGAALFTDLVTVHGCIDAAVSPVWVVRAAKSRIVFDEKIRVGLSCDNEKQKPESVTVVRWVLSSDLFLRFTTPLTDDGNGNDDGRSCMIQALHEATTDAQIYAVYRTSDGSEDQTEPIKIEIISDQVEYTAEVIEAPVIGVSLSTPQLYLLTNIGYQMFKNSMLKPRQLDSVQVAAVLQNTFSAGLYMSGQGDFPIVMNDADSSNLTFSLCDANYHPIKLLSPMYLILKIDPAPNPVEDISQWNQMLPRIRRPQPAEILYTIPRINITEHPNLLNSMVTASGIL